LTDVQQFIDMVKAIVAVPNAVNSHCHCSQTPFNGPTIQAPSSTLTVEHLEQLILKLIQAKPVPNSAEPPETVQSDALEDAEPKHEIHRASKLEFKVVNELYVTNGNCNMAKLTVTQLG
jgi:hypothetical protein